MPHDWDPVKYEEFRAEREMPFRDLLAGLDPVPGGKGIDLGCGTGRLTADLHVGLGLAATLGVDSSPAMIAACAAHDRDGIRFAQGDLADVDRWLEAGPFDVVFSNAALQWLPDHRSLLPSVSHLVAPCGRLAVQVPANTDHPSQTLARDLCREEPWADLLGDSGRPPDVLGPEEYVEVLHALGFEDLEVILRVYPHVLPSTCALVDWMRGTLLNWYLDRLPEDRRAAFVDAYRRRVEALLPDPGPYLFTFKRILFTARRPA
ncbi:MAG: methyltransferase domain-containing protein [Acidimicrobiia bacterium]|nr:methyltransferase domain-containing protein [Acidimicrobiia bacterium]